ncbi:oxidoreductase [Sphingobium tyrosinilyticum]|uniref:Oxidoreductase n=1 Tax=Sphingobium tyrosinilyticum TaxID=2715436 RepID=A0ABV9F388_9SPHN
MTARSQQTWLVTGASSGFGRAIVLAVLAAGGRVIATARDPATLRDIAPHGEKRCLTLPLDATVKSQVANAIAAGEEAFDSIDILVNDAGYGLLDSVEDADEAAIRAIFEVNFFGTANMIRAALKGMRARKRGWIVNIASSGGRLSAPALGYYSAAKHAVEGLSKALREEVEPLGIGVTVVEPGNFRTDFAGRSLVLGAPPPIHYANTVGRIINRVERRRESEVGDPARAADAIIKAVDADNPPQQLLLGADAIAGVRAELLRELEEVERWEMLGTRTAFEE